MNVLRALVATVGAVAAVAAPVITPVWAGSSPAPTSVQTVGVTLTPVGAAHAAAPRDGSEVLESPAVDVDEFSLVGVTWPEDSGVTPEELRIEVRTDDGKGWSAWRAMPALDGGPDENTEEGRRALGTATAPLWVGKASTIQTRVRPAAGKSVAGQDAGKPDLPPNVELRLVNPGREGKTRVRTTPLATASAAGAPDVIDRAQWGADESKKNCDPGYSSTIRGVTVHHTAGGNSYSTRTQAQAQLRADYAYHTDVLGWCDLGYNFVVDKFGNVYEGRAGGIDKPVSGAHAGGFNTDTVGISALGDYSRVDAPAAMVSAMAQVAAWKLGMYDRDPQGTVTLTSAGGTSKYPAGQQVTLPVIFGHRDTGNTACPGTDLYADLGSLRTQAAAADPGDPEPPVSYSLARTASDPKVYVTTDTHKFPVDSLATYEALAPLGGLAVVPPTELSRRATGPGFGRFAVAPDSRVWYLDGGFRFYVTSCETVSAYGQDCWPLPTLSAEQVARFTEGPPLSRFVKGGSSDMISVVADGVRRPVARWSDLVALAGSASPSWTVLADATVAAIPAGQRALPPGVIVKSPSNPRVLLVDGLHRAVPLESFAPASSMRLGPLETVDAAALATYSAGGYLTPTVTCPTGRYLGVAGTLRPVSPGVASAFGVSWLPLDGTTCTALGASQANPAFSGPLFAKADDNPRVYQIVDGTRRPVGSWERLEALAGTSSPTIVVFSRTPLSEIPVGPAA